MAKLKNSNVKKAATLHQKVPPNITASLPQTVNVPSTAMDVGDTEKKQAGNLQIEEPSSSSTTLFKPKEIKRKKLTKKTIKEKRVKPAKECNDSEDDDSEDNEDVEGVREPTEAEINESEKPENILITQRKKKKEKQEKRNEEQKSQLANKEKQKNEDYLRKWKTSPSDWKFEKLRQISIQNSMFDEQKLADDLWPIALEYLAGSKGAAKEAIVKLAEDVIAKLDAECEQLEDETEKLAIHESKKYQRARDILQNCN